MRRREFITLLGGAAAMPMVTAGAQERMRRVGILTASFGVDDPEMQTRNSAFILALREFGWAEGKNVRVEFRSGGGKASDLRKHAAELVSLADVVLANGGQSVSALQDVSRTVPIVFVSVPDPVGARLMLQLRCVECNVLLRDFGIEIARREGEPPRRRGFMEIRERDGPGTVPRDARHRRGRPKKLRPFRLRALCSKVHRFAPIFKDVARGDGLLEPRPRARSVYTGGQHHVVVSSPERAPPSAFVLFHGLSPRVSSRFRRSRPIAEGSFRLASKPVALVAIAGREVEGDKSRNARSLCDVTGLTRREMPPLCGNLRIRVKECRLDEELVGTAR